MGDQEEAYDDDEAGAQRRPAERGPRGRRSDYEDEEYGDDEESWPWQESQSWWYEDPREASGWRANDWSGTGSTNRGNANWWARNLAPSWPTAAWDEIPALAVRGGVGDTPADTLRALQAAKGAPPGVLPKTFSSPAWEPYGKDWATPWAPGSPWNTTWANIAAGWTSEAVSRRRAS